MVDLPTTEIIEPFNLPAKTRKGKRSGGYKQFGEFKRSGGPFEAGDKSGPSQLTVLRVREVTVSAGHLEIGK